MQRSTSLRKFAVLALLAFLGGAGCSFDTGSTDSSTAPGAASTSTAAGFSSQFLASSPDNTEPVDATGLDLSKLPENETQFDSKLNKQ